MQVDVEEEEGRKMMRREVLVWRLSALGPSGSSCSGWQQGSTVFDKAWGLGLQPPEQARLDEARWAVGRSLQSSRWHWSNLVHRLLRPTVALP